MIKSNTSYSFPFQKIFDFLENGINKKLEEFYNSFKNEFFGHRIKKIDLDKREILLYRDSYSDGELEYDICSFENEVRFYFISLIYESFDIIAEGINICFISNQSIYSYLDKLDRQFKGLTSHPINKDFQIFKKHLSLIESELNYYRKLDNVADENRKYRNSPFKPKDNIKRSFFYQLYDIAVLYELIDDFPREDFEEVFTNPSTSKHISFICKNDLIVTFFEGIKLAFENLNASSIGKSKRFLTKQKVIFSSTNFESSKGRIKSNSKFSELNQDLESLISELK